MRGDVLAGRLRRYWIPLWLVDADVAGVWRADVGYDYEVVSYQDRYSDRAGWRAEEVSEKRVRWEPRTGRVQRHYDNVVAPALDDHRRTMDRLGGYDLEVRVAYDAKALTNSAARVPTLSPEAAWPLAEPAFVRAAEDDCRRAAGAAQIRDFVVRADYTDLHWTRLLVPVYTTWYSEGGQLWPVLLNGQSGHIDGVRRASTQKARTVSLILGGVALALFLLGGLLALLGLAAPPVALVGTVLLVGGLAFALTAPIPAIAAWAHNRRTERDDALQ
jgi:hypothetical protein